MSKETIKILWLLFINDSFIPNLFQIRIIKLRIKYYDKRFIIIVHPSPLLMII